MPCGNLSVSERNLIKQIAPVTGKHWHFGEIEIKVVFLNINDNDEKHNHTSRYPFRCDGGFE